MRWYTTPSHTTIFEKSRTAGMKRKTCIKLQKVYDVDNYSTMYFEYVWRFWTENWRNSKCSTAYSMLLTPPICELHRWQERSCLKLSQNDLTTDTRRWDDKNSPICSKPQDQNVKNEKKTACFDLLTSSTYQRCLIFMTMLTSRFRLTWTPHTSTPSLLYSCAFNTTHIWTVMWKKRVTQNRSQNRPTKYGVQRSSHNERQTRTACYGVKQWTIDATMIVFVVRELHNNLKP
jgi:hypothetical protein